jgi:hypothetical protein
MNLVAWILQVVLCLMFLIHAYQMLRPQREQLTSRGMSYIVEMPAGRGIDGPKRPVLRWVQTVGPPLAAEVRKHRRPLGTKYRVLRRRGVLLPG